MESILSASLKEGTATAIVVIIYLIIVRLIDSNKESKQSKLTSSVANAVLEIKTLLSTITEDIVLSDKDKCKMVIETSFESMMTHLISYATTTIVNNHIDTNRPMIIDNIKRVVNGEFYRVYMNIGMFNIDGKKVNSYMLDKWKEELTRDIEECIYMNMNNKEYKIISLINRLNLRSIDYIVYIKNNAFS